MTIEELYHRHGQDVFRFAFWLCGNSADAEDLTAETFVRVWTSSKPIRVATVKGLLFTIVRNLHSNQWRRSAPVRAETSVELADSAPGPDRTVGSKDELRVALAALDTLNETDRAALLMRAEHGLPYSEIAAVLGSTVGAARVRVHRSRLKLAALIDHAGDS